MPFLKKEYSSLERQKHVLELIKEAKENDELAINELLEMYIPLIRSIIFKYGFFQIGGTQDDLIQEGSIGIMKAIKDFNFDSVVSSFISKKGADAIITDSDLFAGFEQFLNLCIRRQLITAIKTASRQKHMPINGYISLDCQLPDNENLSLADLFANKEEIQNKVNFDYLPPEEQVILKEMEHIYETKIKQRLSETENNIFSLYRKNIKYKEIQEILNIESEKKIDNAIQRSRKKIEEIIAEDEQEYYNN